MGSGLRDEVLFLTLNFSTFFPGHAQLFLAHPWLVLYLLSSCLFQLVAIFHFRIGPVFHPLRATTNQHLASALSSLSYKPTCFSCPSNTSCSPNGTLPNQHLLIILTCSKPYITLTAADCHRFFAAGTLMAAICCSCPACMWTHCSSALQPQICRPRGHCHFELLGTFFSFAFAFLTTV